MKLQLIDGTFSATEINDLLTQLYHVKIKFHEQKVNTSGTEEDIKMRERKIKTLQDELEKAKGYLKNTDRHFHIEGTLFLS
jgi:peptidoglycan hydrolase CwlO-like protein